MLASPTHTHTLYNSLLDTTDHTVAIGVIADERAHTCTLARVGGDAQAISGKVIEYLDYFVDTWMPESIWRSWSQMGRSVASVLLSIPIEGVLPTTNHLESFNRLLKRKYIPLWQRSGARLRFDFLISILITHILPGIFLKRQAHHDYTQWLSARFSTHLQDATSTVALASRGKQTESSGGLCWWQDSEQRDANAHSLLDRGHLRDLAMHPNRDGYLAICTSSSQIGLCYRLELHRNGHAMCSCPDFANRGGACKHLRAFRLVIEGWVLSGQVNDPFIFPTSPSAAKRIRALQQPALDLNQPPPPPNPPHSASSTLSAVDNLLALQNLASRSGSSEETFTDDPEEEEDLMDDEAANHSDDSSPSSNSPTKILRDRQSVSAENLINQPSSEFGGQALSQPSIDAVRIQVQQRFDHDVKKLLPSLHGLVNLAEDGLLVRTSDTEELELTLEQLQSALCQALPPKSITTSNSSSEPPVPSNLAHSSGLLPPPILRSSKRSAPINVMPPSPEARQRRKISHSTL